MKLNKSHREEFVQAVMKSVPLKHAETRSGIEAEITAQYTKLVPAELARMLKKHNAVLAIKAAKTTKTTNRKKA